MRTSGLSWIVATFWVASRLPTTTMAWTVSPFHPLSARVTRGGVCQPRSPLSESRSSMMMAEESTGGEASVPFDAAARLAYDEWRAQYKKGAFDPVRFESFKKNYEAITVANVAAKKKARDEGLGIPTDLMVLNEYGDFSEEEYMQAMKAGGTTSTANVLGQAMAAAQSQSEASSALKEAANALAEEEELLAQKLGLGSVEELEQALDSLDGIAEDGGELDNIAREVRVRSAYMEWCRQNFKQPDESRFPIFSNNFLTMEKFAAETGKEMTLNAYADLTKAEYEAMQEDQEGISPGRRATMLKKDIEEAARMAVQFAEAQAAAAKERSQAFVNAQQALEAQQLALLKAQAEANAEDQARFEAARLKKAEELRIKAEQDAERRAAIEKEREQRQKEQEKELAALKAQNEAATIAAARERAAEEARVAAQRRAIEREAAEQARKQAREFEERQRRLAAKRTTPVVKAVKKKVGFFGSFKQQPEVAKPPEPDTRVNVEIDLSKLFPQAAPQSKKKADTAGMNFGSFFGSFGEEKPAQRPVPKKVTPVKVAPVKAAPAKKAPAAAATSVDLADPVTDAFAAFFGNKKETPQAKAAVPPPTPPLLVRETKKAPPAPAAPAFSFFSTPAQSPKQVVPAPKNMPAPKAAPTQAAKPAFSFFGAPEPKPAKVASPAPAPKSAPAPAGKPAFSFFSNPEPKASAPPKVTPKSTPASEPESVFSFFSKPAPKAAPAALKKEDVKIPNRPGTISLFGVASAVSTSKTEANKKDVVIPNRPGTINLLNLAPLKPTDAQSKPSSKKAEANIPILARWKQNPDGSITGYVSNSKQYRTGTQITTSPVGRGAKKGQVVRTGSGSQYLLK